MTISFLKNNFLAIVLPSLRLPPLFILVIAIIILYAAALSFNVIYIQSIGSGIGTNGLLLFSSCGLIVKSKEECSNIFKPRRLSKLQQSQFVLSEDLREILVGLLMGDLCMQKRTVNSNPNLKFEQGLVHKDYLFHLYGLFSIYCRSTPQITNRLPDKRTGNIYTRVTFSTYSLPCFSELYNLFYPEGKKIIPSNIGELLTASSLAYWLADDGTFAKGKDVVILSTDSFPESDVDLLLAVLQNKFGLKCRKDKNINSFRIVIVKSSLGKFRELVQSHLPSSMLYKIGL